VKPLATTGENAIANANANANARHQVNMRSAVLRDKQAAPIETA